MDSPSKQVFEHVKYDENIHEQYSHIHKYSHQYYLLNAVFHRIYALPKTAISIFQQEPRPRSRGSGKQRCLPGVQKTGGCLFCEFFRRRGPWEEERDLHLA